MLGNKVDSRKKQMFVDKDFHSMLKQLSAQKQTTILELTRKMAKEHNPFDSLVSEFNEKKKSKRFDFF